MVAIWQRAILVFMMQSTSVGAQQYQTSRAIIECMFLYCFQKPRPIKNPGLACNSCWCVHSDAETSSVVTKACCMQRRTHPRYRIHSPGNRNMGHGPETTQRQHPKVGLQGIHQVVRILLQIVSDYCTSKPNTIRNASCVHAGTKH
jgi:hypothetical protein